MSWTLVRPKRPRWLVASLAVAFAALAVFAAVSWALGWSPGSVGGLCFGIAAAIVFLIDALYPLRRRLMGWPFGTAQRWLQFHLYGGLLACLFVLIHMGFRAPYGAFGWSLLLLTLWTTLSGLAGVALQKWVPALMTAQLRVEAIFERIPDMVRRLSEEADAILDGASEMLEHFYKEEVRPSLAGVTPSWSYLVDIQGGRERRLAPFRALVPFLEEEDRSRLVDLEAIVTEKLELDAHYTLQRLLRVWVFVHVPPSMLLLGLLVVHLFAVSYF